jgi:hypothetical protein
LSGEVFGTAPERDVEKYRREQLMLKGSDRGEYSVEVGCQGEEEDKEEKVGEHLNIIMEAKK